MKTRVQLLRNELGTVVIKHITAVEQALIVSGAVFWLLVLLAIVRHLVLRSEWLTEDPDIPEPLQRQWNRTNAMPVSDFRVVDETEGASE